MLKLISPAKVNLFLRVIKRRPDGYHELASLFQAISLSDVIHFSISNTGVDHLTCTDPALPTDASNLILKAAELFRRKTGLRFALEAHLEKNIPSQAGFGGGSSNAATTLWAVNQLCGNTATNTELMRWSSEIGSDIPFFFSQGTAYCTGRGEIVQDLPPILSEPLWVVKPLQGLQTQEVFRQLQLSKLNNVHQDPLQALRGFLIGKPSYFNDLEGAAFEALPLLSSLKQSLIDSGFHTVTMTGTGSGFFCLGQAKLPEQPGLFCRSATGLNRTANAWWN